MPVDRKDPHERARRLARLIVGDIVLYNQDKIAEGIKNDTLFQVLEKELEVGRKYYEKNVDPAVAAQADYFNLALVDILVKDRGNVESKIW
ncbi:MAG: hypothetical protein HYT85_03580 [candidate division NC10 bacterium]|nr:hypothetical protein [candidate division NC10 bacterium]MBI2114156.1 hypothetical protein [candidate division NC10 bacterium]MBI2163296.1 hypothetical protein [candidate division NC10 bacterium]MBI2562135.1 hypothetical protein [candidate division NC10 bacterium]MBI4735335.1 hypothetical protein [candidate division NC10 bacterium]